MVDKNEVTTLPQKVDVEEEKRKYRRLTAKRGIFLGACLVLLLVVIGVALALGSANKTFIYA
jgi:hypothetical protein